MAAVPEQNPLSFGAQKNLPETSRKTSFDEVTRSKKDDSETKNTMKPVIGGDKIPASKVVDMFADQESDEEDLFSPSSKPSKSVDKVSLTL